MFQTELLELFDTFRITSPSDYHRLAPAEKPYFIRRLYKVFDGNTVDALSDLGATGGLKLHFGGTGNLEDVNPNVPSETFLKKMAFFANRTLVTFPFIEIRDKKQLRALSAKPQKAWRRRDAGQMVFGEIITGRDGYGGWVAAPHGPAYTIDPLAFDDLLTTACMLRPAIKAGAAYLLPVLPHFRKQLREKRLGLTSANFRLRDLNVQFTESLDAADRQNSGVTHLLLPHFANVPFERILDIRQQEEELYVEFQRRLQNLVAGASQTQSEQRVLEFMREVDAGVREMRRHFYDIQRHYHRKNILLLVKLLAAALVMFAPLEGREALTGILGGTSSFEYFATREDKLKELAGARVSKFYLPWLVFSSAQGG